MDLVTIQMENGKEIELALCPEDAPITVANFIKLVQAGFYDGLILRIIRIFSGSMRR